MHEVDLLGRLPRREDGPECAAWMPATPACGGDVLRPGRRAFKFSVRDAHGVTHRFLLTRSGMAWMAYAFVGTLSPWLRRVAFFWYRRQLRLDRQSLMSSEMPSEEGSPKSGQAHVPPATASAAACGETNGPSMLSLPK